MYGIDNEDEIVKDDEIMQDAGSIVEEVTPLTEVVEADQVLEETADEVYTEPVVTHTTYTGIYSGGIAAEIQEPSKKRKAKKAEKEKKPLSPFKRVILSIATGILFGLCAGATFYFVNQQLGAYFAEDEAPVVNDNGATQLTLPEDLLGTPTSEAAPMYVTYTQSDVSDMVEAVMPAMVSIINNYKETTSFFGQSYTEDRKASGTGFIVSRGDTELLIATNNHVIAGADSLTVSFIDGKEVAAWVKGTDASMDLAVIAVKVSDCEESTLDEITVAKLGNSDTLKLGEPVVAIGNALGYGQSVTTGIVSALNREVTLDDGGTATYVQTDAAINPGNSGGALLNLNGEVIGINSSKIGGSTIDGIGYAIPISSATPIISELMEHQTKIKVAAGDVGYMGISCQEVTSQINQYYGIPMGVYVASVEPGLAADSAGVLQGDIIVGIDGTKITSYAELQGELQYHAADTTIKVSIMRHEQREYVQYDLDMTLGRRPETNE